MFSVVCFSVEEFLGWKEQKLNRLYFDFVALPFFLAPSFFPELKALLPRVTILSPVISMYTPEIQNKFFKTQFTTIHFDLTTGVLFSWILFRNTIKIFHWPSTRGHFSVEQYVFLFKGGAKSLNKHIILVHGLIVFLL